MVMIRIAALLASNGAFQLIPSRPSSSPPPQALSSDQDPYAAEQFPASQYVNRHACEMTAPCSTTRNLNYEFSA